MKFLVVPILIFLVASQAFSKWVMLVEYQWNKDYIAQNLCKNKAKPELKCEGKCQLAKKMAEEDKESSSQTPNLKLKFNEVIFANESPNEDPAQSATHRSKTFPAYLLKAYTAPALSVFHPPA